MNLKKNRKINNEIIGSFALVFSAGVAILMSNSCFNAFYQMLETVYAGIYVGSFNLQKNLTDWTNDGLMVLYFLFIGLEIKREFISGTLSQKSNIIIPAIVALCGLLMPALIYLLINCHNIMYLNGWAIPTATDIAFTLGILTLLKSHIPVTLKILVTMIAVFDDIGAILIIAVFYTHKISLYYLAASIFCVFILFVMNKIVKILLPFIVIGIIMWLCILQSGVHATLSGIALAIFIPYNDNKMYSLLHKLESTLRPWIIFFILPLFAFVNTGINFEEIEIFHLLHPITLGIILGLFIGKQTGIFLSLYIFSKTKYFSISQAFSISQLYGTSLICGIGFTMSLFIGNLAFTTVDTVNLTKTGIITGSLISAISGYMILRYKKP